MNIQLITDQHRWDTFFNKEGSASFLQSWAWGELNAKQGYEVTRLGVTVENRLVGVAQVMLIKSKRATFLFVPHGPVVISTYSSDLYQKLLEELTEYLAVMAKKHDCSFIRISPQLTRNDANAQIYRSVGYQKSPIYMHAETMWVLPLNKTEDELLAAMRKTTRYLIKRSDRDGVTVEMKKSADAIEDFWALYEETARREHFTPFSRRFIEREYDAFAADGNAAYFIGKADGKVLASALIVYTQSTAFYHQGASLHSQLPVPYALQWQSILEAKRRGCTSYNFWGITDPGRAPKAWAGLTMFKKGFGGHEVQYVYAQDYVINLPKYLLSSSYERLLALKRGI
jgi:lipid II:glycine glycyltransferase (peptidoglycan interpeptide bridge formation enzyme)